MRMREAVPGARPSGWAMLGAERLLEPWWRRTRPEFFGLERVPAEGPLLFVGNHTLMGVLDAPLMWLHLYRERGLFLRSLGHHVHFALPGWRELLWHFGVVDGNRENCARLMRAGESILVFPGGGREVTKRKGEKYKLIWKDRVGFARLAIENGCQIVPFAAVGAEEMLDIVLDADELMATPIGDLVRRLDVHPDLVFPIVRGVGPWPIPRPERLYFRFGEPIDPTPFAGLHEDFEACFTVREQVREAVEHGIEWLQRHRAAREGLTPAS